MKTLAAKIIIALVVLTTLAAIPTKLRADGNPTPTCNGKPLVACETPLTLRHLLKRAWPVIFPATHILRRRDAPRGNMRFG